MEITNIENISIKEVLDGDIIGIATVHSHYDIINGNTITPSISGTEAKYNSETGEWIWDGEYSYFDKDLGSTITYSYPASASYSGSTVHLGQDNNQNVEAESMKGFVFFDREINTYEQEVLDRWYTSINPINRQISYVEETSDNAQEWITTRQSDSFYTLTDNYKPIYEAAQIQLGNSIETLEDNFNVTLTDSSGASIEFVGD